MNRQWFNQGRKEKAVSNPPMSPGEMKRLPRAWRGMMAYAVASPAWLAMRHPLRVGIMSPL